MRSNPEPIHTALDFHRERAIVCADASRPVASELLEMKRRMPSIGLEQMEILVGELAYFARKTFIQRPEGGRCIVLQIFRAFPAL